ncbi:MAG TPA: GNAT family N-acetyltransferase [Candidatus Binatia bacterium]|nr:GNAT family N-acetyltransferase [Candidatus Binatia bacterium]
MRSAYRKLPESVRRCLRPLNLLDEVASFLPGPVRPRAHGAAEAMRRLGRVARIRYPVRRLEGTVHGSGRRLTCLVASDELSARYWTTTVFAEPPRETIVGHIGALAAAAACRRLAPAADLSLWQAPWPVSALARGPRIPSWLPLWLATDRSLDDVIAGERSGRAARKNDVRRVQRLGLRVRLATDAEAYDAFRRELYEPYIRQRFGDLLVALPAHAFQHARRNGWLLVAELDGRAVGGALIERWGAHPRVLVFGVDTRSTVPTGTLLEACYYHSICFAVERGFARLSLGTCRPVLTDGVLRYKRKWGGTIGRPATWDAFLFRYRNTPAVRDLLTEAPLVVDAGRGRLAALVGAAGDAAADVVGHVQRMETPGLAEIACLVEPTVTVGPDVCARHASLRIVPPGDVWPVEAAA